MRKSLLVLFMVSMPALAQMVEVQDNPPSGKEKAREYFTDRKANAPAPAAQRAPTQEGGGGPRYLALHIGSFFTSQAYKWGDGDQDDKAKLNAGVTYRLGEWVNSMDLAFRFDYTNFQFDEGSARKLSAGVIITFPDASSRFPLYFGGGLGAGFMIKQINDESALALDYSLIAGARFLNVIESIGFMVETGLKNHLHLLSDGQFNGVFFNVGTVFNF